MADFESILATLSRLLDAKGISAPLFGGFVLPAYGVERMTLDLDFMLAPEDLADFQSILEELGYERVLKTSAYAKFRHKEAEVLDIDTVFTSSDSIDTIMASHSRRTVLGVEFACVSLDILLGTKLHAIRYNEANRGHRDIDDAIALIRANGIDLASESFKALCDKYGTESIYNRLLKALHDDES